MSLLSHQRIIFFAHLLISLKSHYYFSVCSIPSSTYETFMVVKTDPPAEMATKFINSKFIPISDANSRKTKCGEREK